MDMFPKLFSKHHSDSKTLNNPTPVYFPCSQSFTLENGSKYEQRKVGHSFAPHRSHTCCCALTIPVLISRDKHSLWLLLSKTFWEFLFSSSVYARENFFLTGRPFFTSERSITLTALCSLVLLCYFDMDLYLQSLKIFGFHFLLLL